MPLGGAFPLDACGVRRAISGPTRVDGFRPEIVMTMSTATQQDPSYQLADYRSLENEILRERINRVRQRLGPELLILGHHYQQDEVIALSDLRGDSYELSKMAASNTALPIDRVLRCPFHGRNGRHPGQSSRAVGSARRATRAGGAARPGRRLLDGGHGGD